jgi:hypothetical protein
MDFDAWHHWLLLRPLFVFLLACPFVVLAVLVDRYAEWRGKRRTIRAQENKVVREPTAIQDAASQVDQIAACEEHVSQHAGPWSSLPEWEGEQPRPNWNRRSG